MKIKRTKIKRLNNNEVALVAEMQSKIDFYERFLNELWMIVITGKDHPILEGGFSSEITGDIYKFIKEHLKDK